MKQAESSFRLRGSTLRDSSYNYQHATVRISPAHAVQVVITLTNCVLSDLKTVSSSSRKNICLLQAPSAGPELQKEAIIKDQAAVLEDNMAQDFKKEDYYRTPRQLTTL